MHLMNQKQCQRLWWFYKSNWVRKRLFEMIDVKSFAARFISSNELHTHQFLHKLRFSSVFRWVYWKMRGSWAQSRMAKARGGQRARSCSVHLPKNKKTIKASLGCFQDCYQYFIEIPSLGSESLAPFNLTSPPTLPTNLNALLFGGYHPAKSNPAQFEEHVPTILREKIDFK